VDTDEISDSSDRIMGRKANLAGVVLAGGYATRFGDADKAVADLAGRPMIAHVVEALSSVTDEIVLNCRDVQQESLQTALEETAVTRDLAVRFAIDPVPDRGPVAGIATGLETASRPYSAVVACDMPFCSPRLFDVLATAAEGRDGALVRDTEGWYQPTHAVYRTAAMATACQRLLEDGGGKVLSAIEALDCVVLEAHDLEIPPRAFESIDTQAELEAANRALE